MDISNLTQNLMKGLEQKTNSELTALSRVLDIALGKVTIAQVTETIPVTPAERQALLNKTAEALAKLAGNPSSTPAAKEETSRLLEQQLLIKSADLKWVNLLVNNRQLLTYSNKPLAAGQTVAVRLVTPEKLMLLDLPDSDGSDSPAPPANKEPARPAGLSTYTAQSLATQSQLAKSIPVGQDTPASEIPEDNTENVLAIKNTAASSSAVAAAKIQMAVVTETAPITADERQELLKKTTEELVQLGKLAQSPSGPTTPGLKQAIASLAQQQALIKSPDSKWIHLQVNNQSLLTYSDKPLVAGQPIAVQVVTPQKILLLELPETEDPQANKAATETADSKLKLLSETINSALASGKNLTPTYFARLAVAEQSTGPSAAPEENLVSKNTAAVATTATAAKTHTAIVTETAPLLAQERKELLKKTTEEVAQLTKMASASAQPIPGLKEAINSLLQQQALIKAPEAKWVHLQVGKQSLLTYSDKPLEKGQSVQVQLVTPQKILLLDPSETAAVKDNSSHSTSLAAAQKHSTPTYFAKLAHTEPDGKDSSVERPDAKQPSSILIKNTSATAAPPVKIQMALVTETAPITADERQELLKKTTEELVQLNKMSSTAAGVKEAIASLLQQQALIKSPATQWVHLSVNNQSLLTYSDKPLAAGQAVPVQVISPQKIALLDLPDSNIKVLTESINAALASQKNITPTYFARLATAIASAEQRSEAPESTSEHSPAIKNPTALAAGVVSAKIQIATATQTAPITAEERQELLKKTSEELTQLNKILSAAPGAAVPGVKDAIAALLQQQALIKSPEAKWLQLQVNNQSLLTYSDKSLTPGQTLPVQVITPQKILLLDLPDIKSPEAAAKASAENLPPTLAAQKNATPTYFATLASPDEPTKAQATPSPILPKETAGPVAPSADSKIEIATIVKSTPVSPQQRQELLQKITEDLQQINKLANSSAQTIPSVKDLVSSLLEQQALLKSPSLKWLELSVNNRPVTTYTDKSLSPGQTLQLQLSTSQSLAILDSEKLAAGNNPANAGKYIQPPEKLASKAEFAVAELAETEDEKLLATAPTTTPWQHIPNLTRQILTPKTLEQALKSLAEQIRSQLQLSQLSAAATKGTAANDINSPTAQPATKLQSAQTSAATASDEKVAGKAAAKAEVKSGQAQLLVEIDQVLNGSPKKLSTELTAKLLQELLKTQASQTAIAQATTKTIASQAVPGKATQASENSSADIELAIQQLLHRPATDANSKAMRAQLLQLMQHDPETFTEMDIGKLTQHLSKGLEQKNNTELTALNRALNITLGKVVMADVSETAPVTPQERKELLAKTSEALAQLNKLASNPALLPPATKAAINQLLEQQALIQSPNLKWATLMVNNRPVLTYTDKPLNAGQAVPVQLVDAQKLVLLTLPEGSGTHKNPAANLTTAALGTNANPTYSAKLASSALLAELAKNTTATNPLSPDATKALATPAASGLGRPSGDFANYKQDPQQIKQVVADNLRRLLPYKDMPSVLLSALTQWQKLPAASQQRLAPVTVEQALKNLAEQIRSPLQIIQPKVLAEIIKNSGVFFENALSTSQPGSVAGSGSTGANAPEGSKALTPGTYPSVAQTFNQDLKGSLLTLLSKVNQELTGSSKPLSDEQTVKLLQQLSSYAAAPGSAYTPATAAAFAKHNLPVDIGLLIQQVMSKPVKELSDKELRSQLLVLLQQHSVHSLAKIQLQQLASLNGELASKDPSQPTASWQIEIPVRHHNEVQQLQLRIEREWVEEKNSSPESKTIAKVKQWSVTLRFDLPTLGEFCAQLAIIDTSVSATLWATEEKTFGQVRKQMEDLRKNLEKEGINVKQLQCMKGMPAQKPMALSYSLIDIST